MAAPTDSVAISAIPTSAVSAAGGDIHPVVQGGVTKQETNAQILAYIQGAIAVTAAQISNASADGQSLITAANYAAMKTLLALVIGTNVQAWDADLDTLAGMGATRAGLLAALPAFIQSLLDDVDAATARGTLGAGVGSVTSVALTVPSDMSVSGSPITGSGTLGITRNTQNANLVQAGPASGAAAAPTFRALVSADGTALNDASNGSLFDHFLTTVPTSGTYGALNLVADISGSGASVGIIAPPDATANGVDRCSSGTTTTGRAGVRTAANALRFSGGVQAFACRFQIPTLLDGTESGAIYVGFGDDLTAAPVDGAYLYWDNTQTNFRYRTRSNSTETDIDSGLPPVAATWYTVSIAVNAAGTSVTFTINGGNSQASTTNIPTAAGRETGLIANIIKSAGTTARFLYLDSMRWGWAGY